MGLDIVLQESIQNEKKKTNTKGNMLGNLDLILQLESKVLVYFQVQISYVLSSAKPNLRAH